MSATNQFELDLLELLFTNATAPNIGDGTGIAGGTVGTIQVSLHTAAMAETDTLTTANEAAYAGPYARQTVARSVAGWTSSSPAGVGTIDNDALITFPTATGSETETDFGLTMQTAGDFLQIFGALTSSLAVSNGVTPEFATQALAITLD